MKSWSVRIRHFAAPLAVLLAAGCTTVRVPPSVPLLAAGANVAVPESQLLDVAITVFTPLAEVHDTGTASIENLRLAESHYTSWQLAQTLQTSGQWGTIHLNPFMTGDSDLTISGTLLQSDGETLRISVQAADSSGRLWLDKEYFQVVNADDYAGATAAAPPFPFQSLFNQIANDVLDYRENGLTASDLQNLRLVSALGFAADFAPERFGPYLARDSNGHLLPGRLPAANDPVLMEIAQMRARNALFLDVVQAQYSAFVQQVAEPYRAFLARSHGVTVNLNNGFLEIESRKRGASKEMLGSRAIDSRRNNQNRRSDALNTGSNARVYDAVLASAGLSFEMHVQPHSLEFSTHTVNLSGSLEEQFAQWRAILRELHALDAAL